MKTTTLPRPAEKLCLAISRTLTRTPLRRFSLRANALGNRYDSMENYRADRVSNIDTYRALFSSFASFRDKTVLDLGCSSGYLLNAFLQHEPFTAIGADISTEMLAKGHRQYGNRIRFVQTTATSVPLQNSTIDLAYTVDTVEHLSQPAEIFAEIHRVLKPGGLFFVHFGPWYALDGAHLEEIIPFPWPHVFFSMDTLLNVAAHIYDSPDYEPACYWFDEETGERRPNPYRDREKWRTYLNRLTIRGFTRMVRALPFEQVHLRRIGFGGNSFKVARLLRGLAQVPVVDEYCAQTLFCVLRKRHTG